MGGADPLPERALEPLRNRWLGTKQTCQTCLVKGEVKRLREVGNPEQAGGVRLENVPVLWAVLHRLRLI